MAKVDWITWNTDSADIINPDKVVEKILEIYQDFNSYIQSNIYEIVKKETANVYGIYSDHNMAVATLNIY